MSNAYPPQQVDPRSSSLGLPQAPRRLPVQPPGITTTLTAAQRFGPRLVAQTPVSPRPGATPASPAFPYAPSAYSPSAASPMPSAGTPMSSSSTYNPQEWAQTASRPGSYASQRSHGQTGRVGGRGEVTGMEAALPSPPPPYSASPQSTQPASLGFNSSPNAPSFSSQTASPTNHAGEYNISAGTTTSVSPRDRFSSINRTTSNESSAYVQNVQRPPSTTFSPPPPPPNERDRSVSRSRFTLASLTGRSRPMSSTSPESAMEALQQQTSAAILQTSHSLLANTNAVVPSTARRAASTGGIGAPPGPGRRPSQPSTPLATNEPSSYGFALPPPPLGPPPALRSQSLNRVEQPYVGASASSSASAGGPAVYRGASRSNALGSIPPTPAGWKDEDLYRENTPPAPAKATGTGAQSQPESGSTPIRQTQHSFRNGIPSQDAEALSSNSIKATTRDDSVAQGMRERRSQSRAKARSNSRGPSMTAHPSPDSASCNGDTATPTNLVLRPASGAISRRRHVSKAKISPLLDGRLSPSLQRTSLVSDSTSSSHPNSGSLPPDSSSARDSAPTTPYPGKHKLDLVVPSPKTPASPSWGKRPVLNVGHASERFDRLRSPLPPLTTTQSSSAAFAQGSLDRCRSFVEQEAKAKNDDERLNLFSKFFVQESRIRRDRYGEAFEALGSDVIDLTRDLWRSQTGRNRNKTQTPSSGQYTPSRRMSEDSKAPEPSSASSVSNRDSVNFTPVSEPGSPGSPMRAGRTEQRTSFHPILSPIPSMAMSTVPDDEGSRGRASSRWWEGSTDAQSVGGTGRVFRTKREAKYMGVPREARENMQWAIPEHSPDVPSSSNPYGALGPDEYPPEKLGWHEASTRAPEPKVHTPSTPNSPRLDVSRLITLPPPYPRHHPAVNNNHPNLNQLRVTLRSFHNREEINEIRIKWSNSLAQDNTRSDDPARSADRRKKHRQSIQEQISAGNMSFAEAAKAEENFEAAELKWIRDDAQKAFENFQTQVVAPLHSQYTKKLSEAVIAIEKLSEDLKSEARSNDPNQIQEEGDEQPELLEKLTLLKWLNDAREQLQKEQFGLEGESNDKYKAVILLPYRQANNPEKVREVDAFFSKDARDRNVDYDRKAAQRFKELLRVTEKHAMRGVEIQLSAFWDIAPELLAVVQKVPSNLNGFEILIPPQEYEENPTYSEYPLQYLYSLLLHAERSTYQFIESQTNLLCLLHEAKTSVMFAECRLTETERCVAGEDPKDVERLTQRIRRDEDAGLTTDLKERVELVEDQWREALGTGLRRCQERIKVHLEELGGFDETLLD